MRFGRFQAIGGRIADAAMRRARGKASSMTDQGIRAAVDRGIRALEVASEQVRQRGTGAQPYELGVTLNMGPIEMHIRTTVPASGQGPGPSVPALPEGPDP